jgi:hypothetical protein
MPFSFAGALWLWLWLWQDLAVFTGGSQGDPENWTTDDGTPQSTRPVIDIAADTPPDTTPPPNPSGFFGFGDGRALFQADGRVRGLEPSRMWRTGRQLRARRPGARRGTQQSPALPACRRGAHPGPRQG